MTNQANIVQNGIAGPVYLVDANGNPISVSNPLGVNASFSASSISINDPTTTTNKATVDGSGNLHVAISGPLAAGTNVIGHVIVDSAGSVSVTSLPSIPAGTNVIGHVVVDSASSVAVTSLPTLPSGTNVIGHVIVDSAGSVSITSLPSLPAGSNVIGHVIVDSASSVAVTSLPALPAGSNSIGAVTNTQPDTTTSGTITAAQPVIGTPVSNATVTIAVGTGQSSWGAVLSGTFSAGSTIVVDHSRDGGTTWIASSFKVSGSLQNTTVQSITGGATTEINGNDAGVSHIRVRCSVLQGGDSISVAIRAGYGIGGVGLLSSIPAGNNLIGGVNLVDSAGTNKAAIDSSGNLAIRGGFTEQGSLSAGSLNADLVASVDVSAYKSLAIQVNGTFTGTLTFQWSNDNSNFVSLSTFYGSANTQPVSSTTTTGLWISSVCARYLRIRMTAYTSGSATGVLELYTHSANAYPSVNALAAQSGTWASQILDSGGTNKLAVDSSGRLTLVPNQSTNIAQVGGSSVALGQTTMSNSLPVTMASNQGALGSVVFQAVAGTALAADQTSSELRVSLYGKNSAAGDTAILVDSTGRVMIGRNCVAVYTLASTTTSGTTQNSGDLTVGAYTEISIDINTTAQAGTSPTIQYFYERKGADGIYYVLWQSAVLTAATNTLSTSIGAGMAYNQSLGLTGRLRWVIGGSATPTYTHTLNVYGK